MSMHSGGSSEPPTRDELRRLEARIDARLQEVQARIVLHDGRFTAMSDRIAQADRRGDALSARIDSRLRSMDRRFDSMDTRLEANEVRLQETRDRVIQEFRVARREQAKMTLLGVAGSTVTTASLCFGTFVVLV